MNYKEFSKLPEEEKSKNYENLSNRDRFLARINAPLGKPKTIGHRKLTKEDLESLKELEKYAERCMKNPRK